MKTIRMRWRYPLLLLVLAVGTLLVAWAYGVHMVGVPTQDPTPAIAVAEARDADLSGWGMLLGAALLLVSLVWLAMVAFTNFTRRPAVR